MAKLYTVHYDLPDPRFRPEGEFGDQIEDTANWIRCQYGAEIPWGAVAVAMIVAPPLLPGASLGSETTLAIMEIAPSEASEELHEDFLALENSLF